jgi:hypothetical protein
MPIVVMFAAHHKRDATLFLVNIDEVYYNTGLQIFGNIIDMCFVCYKLPATSTTISGITQVDVESSTWYTQANYRENLSVSNSLLMIKVFFMYLLPGSGKIRYYGKLGLNAEYLLKSSGNVYSNWSANYTDYHSFNPPYSGGSNSGTYEALALGSGALSADIAVGGQSGRHRVEVAYNSPMNLGGVGQPTFKMGNFGLFYFFTILR